LLRRFHEATQRGDEEGVIWGSGRPRREFLHVADMAAANAPVMELSPERYREQTQPMRSHLNVGTGVDCTIAELAQALVRVTGFKGRLRFDASKPDGAPRKLLDVSRINALGWEAYVPLEDGLRDAYNAYLAALEQPRGQ
jgi:GDP-L-fucose synthase